MGFGKQIVIEKCVPIPSDRITIAGKIKGENFFCRIFSCKSESQKKIFSVTLLTIHVKVHFV